MAQRARNGDTRRRPRYGIASLAPLHRFRAGDLALGQAHLLLGARLGPVFGSGGATSLVGDASLGVTLTKGWSLTGAWRQMWTRPDRAGLVAGGALTLNVGGTASLGTVSSAGASFDAGTVEQRPSKAGNYMGLTLSVHVTSREQLDELYRTLTTHPMVKVVL